jgi:hypothetical protein
VIQYWIQTPVENAREAAQRFLYTGVTPGYEGYELSYAYDTEAVSFKLDNTFTYNLNKIYFGEVRLLSNETALKVTISDSLSDFTTLDCSLSTVKAGRYPYIVFNKISASPSGAAYFHGYKFTIDIITPQFSYLLTEAGEYLTQEDGSKFII